MNADFRYLTPTEFANLSLQGQRDYQTAIADDIFQRSLAGEDVTEAEADYAQRVLLKKLPGAPTPTGFENITAEVDTINAGLQSIAKGAGEAIGSLGQGTGAGLWSVLKPVLLLGLVAALIIWLYKGGGQK